MGSKSQGGVEIITKIAAQSLATLAQEASQLLVGANRTAAAVRATDDPATTVATDTTQYVANKFADTYGYYYNGLQSEPPGGATIVLATTDNLIWDPAENQNKDIETYLKNVFKATIPDSDSINLSQNLASLFNERFTEISLSWTDMSKRFTFSDKTKVDVYFTTATATDDAGNIQGLATYACVGYQP